MADNTTITAGSGTTIAADDVSGVLHQRVKIEFGTDGVATDVSNSDPLPVTGTVTANLSATDNAVLDDIAADTEAIKTSLAGTLTVTGGGGGTEYTEGATDASITGSAILWEDTGDTLRAVSAAKPLPVDIQDSTIAVTQSGTWDEVGINDSGNSITVDAPVATPVFVRLSDGSSAISTLPVSVASVPSHAVTNAGTFVVQENGAALTALQLIDNPVVVDDAAFTPATTSVMMAGFEYDDTTPDSVNEGDAGAARMSANRNIYTTIRDAAGNERGVNVNASGQMSVSVDNTVTVGSHAVTNAGTFVVQENGAALTALQLLDDPVFADDAAFTVGTSKVNAMGMIADSTSTDKVDEGDIGIPRMTLDRRPIMQPYADPSDMVDGTASATDTTNTSVIAAQGAGTRLYITSLIVWNSSATDTYVNIKSATTTKLVLPAPATTDTGGGSVISLPVPLRLGDNEALNFASGSSVTTMYVSAVGYKSTV